MIGWSRGPSFGGFISAAATTTTFWMDGDSVVMSLFSPLPSRCLPAGVQRRDGVLDVRERARARVRKCMDRLCIFFSVMSFMYFDTPRLGACWSMGRRTYGGICWRGRRVGHDRFWLAAVVRVGAAVLLLMTRIHI